MANSVIDRFKASRCGNIAIAAGLLAVPLGIAVGYGLDTANMARVRSALQDAADAAVFVAAVSNIEGNDTATTTQLGADSFDSNLQNSTTAFGKSAPTFQYLGSATDADGQVITSVSAVFSYQRILDLPFGSQGDSSNLITVKADAVVEPGEPACIFALNKHAARAVEVSGSSSVNMEHCVIGSNSDADDALYVGGSGTLTAECAVSSGGIDDGGGLATSCATDRTNAWRTPDPLGELVEPVPGVLLPNPSNTATTVSPGRYSNLALKGTKTLEPGFYYVEGSLSIQGDITANNVTIFMADGAVSLTGSANLVVSPQTTGDYAGISFFGSRTNTNVQKFTGNGTIDVDGYVYFPSGDVIFQGNSTEDSDCLRIIADTITMTGNTAMENDCDTVLGGRETRLASFPRLIR